MITNTLKFLAVLTALGMIGCSSWEKSVKGKNLGQILGITHKRADPPAPAGPQVAPDGPLIRVPDVVSAHTREDQIRAFLHDLTTKTELKEGTTISADQIKGLTFDPLGVTNCAGLFNDPAYQALAGSLGGFKWGYGVTNYRNDRVPHLYNQRPVDNDFGGGRGGGIQAGTAPAAASKADAASSAAPTIQRADLIGQYGNFIVFLSKRFGLFFVRMPDNATDAPQLSCSVLVPGEPLNFYVDQGMLVLLVNPGDGSNDAAVIRYSMTGLTLKHVDEQFLKGQRIVDSRLFNDTLAVYSRHEQQAAPVPTQQMGGGGSGGAVAVGRPAGTDTGGAARELGFYQLAVLSLHAGSIETKFQETFPEEDGFYPNVFGAALDASAVGKVTNSSSYFNNFLAASDRYLAITKLTRQSVVTKIVTQVQTYQTCTNYQDHYQQISYDIRTPHWLEVANPGFDPAFSCTDATTFDSCIAANATKFVKSTWTFEGYTDEAYSYWQGRCLTFAEQTFTSQYPVTEERAATELIVYRFEGDSFTRLTRPAAIDLTAPVAPGPGTLVVDGWLKEYKSVNFRDGHLYAVTSHGNAHPWWSNRNDTPVLTTSVNTFTISGDAFVKTATLDGLSPGEELQAVLFNQATLFLVTFRQTDPFIAIDLSNPASPKVAGSLVAPGFSSQLQAIDGQRQVFGIGSEQESTAYGSTQRAKISLYDTHDLKNLVALGTLTLGQDADYSASNVANDDQLFHFDAAAKRLFLPFNAGTAVKNSYQGLVCWENRWEYENRLSISSMTPTGIVAEAEVVLPQQVLRTQSYDAANALAFADAGVFHVVKGADGKWSAASLRDLYVTEGLYTDASLPAGMAVAIQVKRNGGTATNVRLALGTPDQLMKNEGLKTMDLPANVTACLGDPSGIRFLDDNVVFSFATNEYKNNQSIEYRTRFAYHVGADGFAALPDDQGKAMEAEGWPICYFAAPLAETVDFGGITAKVLALAPPDLQCEVVSRLPYSTPIMCDYRFPYASHGYCAERYYY